GVSGLINGGGGGGWVVHFAHTTRVPGHLATRHAPRGGGGGEKNPKAHRGQGHRQIDGSSPRRHFGGGSRVPWFRGGTPRGGRNLLIGGPTGATITGGSSDDIVVAGTTTFDANPAALASLLAEWQRTDKTFAERMTAIQGGTNGWNGANHLQWAKTVFDNGGQ